MAQIQIISGANLKAGDSTNKNPFIFPHSQTPRDRHDKKKPVANLLLLCSHRQVGPLCHSLQGQRKVAPDKNEKFHVGSSVVRFARKKIAHQPPQKKSCLWSANPLRRVIFFFPGKMKSLLSPI
jgi:hypothetical protein